MCLNKAVAPLHSGKMMLIYLKEAHASLLISYLAYPAFPSPQYWYRTVPGTLGTVLARRHAGSDAGIKTPFKVGSGSRGEKNHGSQTLPPLPLDRPVPCIMYNTISQK
jgi:hypothetical protein